MYCCCRTKHHHRNVCGGKLWPSQRKYGLCFFFWLLIAKKGGKKEATSQKMKASLEHVETEFQLGWPPHDPSVCSDVQCFMSLDWLLRLTIWQKNQSQKHTENSSIALLSINILWLHFHRTNASRMYNLFWTMKIDTVMLQSVHTLKEI